MKLIITFDIIISFRYCLIKYYFHFEILIYFVSFVKINKFNFGMNLIYFY